MPSANPYFDLLDEREQAQTARINAAATLTFDVQPDAAARQRQVAAGLGVPPAAVQARPQESEQLLQARQIDADTARAPVLRQKYTDADFMRLARDDSGVLSGIETVLRRMLQPADRPLPKDDPVMSSVQFSDTVRRMVERNPALDYNTARALAKQGTQIEDGPTIGPTRGPTPSVGSVARGLFSLDRFRAMDAGLSIAASDALGLDPQPAIRQYGVAKARAANNTPEFETSTGQGLYAGAESLINNAPGLALSVITGNPLPGLALAGAQTSAEAYGKYRERGGTGGQAALGSLAEGAVEIGTEFLPMSFLVKKLGKAGAGEFVKGILAREMPGEQVATFAQDAIDTAIANPDKTWADFLRERPDAAYQTALAVLVQSGAMSALHVAARRALPHEDAAAKADATAQTVQELGALQAASKLAGRDPGSFTEFVRQVAEEGETPKEFFADAQQVADVLNQSGVPMETLRQAAPEVVQQLQDATPGGDVRLPVAELVALGPQFQQSLLDHLRESPEAMSRSEAQQFLSEQEAKIKADVERELARREEATAFRQQVEQATAQFEQQLAAVGRFPADTNRAYASLLGNFYATQALRAGVPLEDMLQRYGLNIVAQTPAGALLDQDVPLKQTAQVTSTPAFRKWFGDSKVVNAEGKPLVVYHGTASDITEFDGRSKYEGGIYFTANPRYASGRARIAEGMGHGPAANVVPAYVHIANPAPAAMSVAEAKAAGHDGIIRDNEVVAFHPEQIKSATGNDGTFDANDPSILSQSEARVTRGSFSPTTNTMALLKAADLSTFIHESGHFFLEVQADLAARVAGQIREGASVTDGERQIASDMGRILKWFGEQDGEKVLGEIRQAVEEAEAEADTPAEKRQAAAMRDTYQFVIDHGGAAHLRQITSSLELWADAPSLLRTPYHERWARGFERFVMEGKAPSLELSHLFARFRAWLVQVYRTLTSLNADITDDVRQVMGRMLASDQAIADAQAARDMGPMFQTPEQAGMTPDEYADYQALAERATAEASAELDSRMLRDMKWLSRARDKALKEAQATANAARGEVEREVRAEVMAEPIYRAWAFLTGKQNRVAPGTVAVENIDGAEHSGRLRTSFVKEGFPEQFPRLRDLGMLSETHGMDPDIVAEVFGFASGEQLIKQLGITAEPAKVIEELTDFRTLQRHGDITSPEALNRAADEAVHNELRARVIANELKALARANKVTATGDDPYKKRDVVNVMAKAAREYAAQVVARQRIRDLRPAQYAAAEARSAKLAMQSLGKSTEEAAMHKRNQLVNNFAAKAAYEAQAEIRKATEFFRRVLTGNRDDVAKTRDWDMVQAARAILASYGLGTKGEAAQKYLDAIAQYDPATAAVLREKVDALTANPKPLKDLTIEEFRGLADEVKSLWYLAKRSRQVEIDGKLIDIEAAKLPLIQRMEDIGIPDRMPGEDRAVTDSERRIARLRGLGAALRRVESWVERKDGEAMGPFRRYVWQPVKDAADAYRADKAKFLRRYQQLLARVDVKPGRIEAPELGPRGYTFGYSRGGSGKAELLHAILHTGNESNLRKLLLGRRWAIERPDGTVDTTKWDAFVKRMIDTGVLTKADFEFAQGVWDLLEETKPLAQKAHRDVFGRYFDEVTAQPFTNQFGAWRGGYVPAMTDSEIVRDAATRSLQEQENQALQFAFPTTNKGFTKSRVEYNAPLLLDLRVLGSHIDKVLLFSHLEQPIREVRRILTSKQVASPLHRIDPAAFDGLLTPWLNRAARQSVETPVPGDNGLMRFFSKARTRAGMAAMFANVTNAAQQITGLSIAAVKVKPSHLLAATVDYAKAPRQTARAVADASPFMAERMDNEVAHMNDAIEQILLNPSVYENAQRWTAKHAYFLQSAFDNVVGPIVWTGAYNQYLEAGHSEKDARRLADAAVRLTQGSTLPEDVSRIETGNAFVRMFTQFAGYFNMQANLLGTEFGNQMHDLGLRRGMGRGLYIFILGFYAPAVISELIVQAARGGPDDDDHDGHTLGDWLAAVFGMGPLRAGLAMVPGVGQVANATINTFNKKPYDDRISTAPAISMIESAVSAPHSVYKAVMEDGSRKKAVRDVATLITMTTGLPATAVARPLGYAADVQQGKAAPTGPLDATRGAITGTASPESKR